MVRLAIVGAGGVSHRHVDVLNKMSNVRIEGVIDVDKSSASIVAAKCGAIVYDKLGDCLDKVDAVYVLTPPSSHREISVEAMKAGKHVVCEKPISISIEDAKIMIQTAKEMNVKLMVAFKNRFRKGYKLLKNLVETPEFGDIVSVWFQRLGMGAGKTPEYNWRNDPAFLCGMTVESLSHDIDLIRWLAGDFISLKADTYESNPELPGFDDTASIVMTLANGGAATMHASWASYINLSSRGIIGSKGTAYLSGPALFDLEYFHWRTSGMKDEMVQRINDFNDSGAFVGENEHFIDCIENDRQPSVTGEDGLKTLQISHAILLSNKEKRVVYISEFN